MENLSLNGKAINNDVYNTDEKMRFSKRTLTINITTLTDEQKDKLRGAIKFFTGDRNNCVISIINGEKTSPAGGIYMTEQILEEFKVLIGEENVEIN